MASSFLADERERPPGPAGLSLLLAAVLAGCATQLAPAPGADVVPGVGRAARDEQAGVEIIADAGAWRGVPPDLDEALTPILVTITNRGRRPIEIRYEHFALVTPAGGEFAALPPFAVEGVVYAPTTIVTPPLGFGVAPYLSPWYPGWSVWDGPFPYHAHYYETYYPAFERITLPTGDMIQKSLPEGVLQPGGRITGFVFFEEVEDVSRVTFVARLIDAAAEVSLGTLEIPFIVE
ncbi:MAG TPA: hypothetical protein VIK91_28060 [Nannocystis sp.]